MKSIIAILIILFCAQNAKVSGLTGGEPVKEGEFPFLVSIKYGNCHFCSGTIIGDRWILTSNICYSRAWWGSISFSTTNVRNGGNCGSYNSTIQRSIDDVLYNPNAYDLPPYTHDLVLIHLNESIPFGENVQPVQLPEVDEPWPSDRNATILGWSSEDSSSGELNLQKAQVPIYSEEYCSNSSIWDGWAINDPTVMLCGGVVNEIYYCYSDLGGPLLVDGKQYGIISYIFYRTERTCGQFLGIFSPVAYFRQWIKDTTGI